jgi:hypothetical protein
MGATWHSSAATASATTTQRGRTARSSSRPYTICAQRKGWSFKNPGGDDPKIDRGADMNDFYASAKVTVGDSLWLDREKALYASDRAYEAPGRGGLLIMPQLDFIDEDYAGHLPMYQWGDWTDLERKIGHYLTNDADNQAVRQETQAIVRED